MNSNTEQNHPAIRVSHVSHTFQPSGNARGVQALDDVSLEIRRGELLCLIGPSGCGKSTLLNFIGGLGRPSQGDIFIENRPVTGTSPQEVAFVFQENALFPWYTITENISVALEFQGVPASQRKPRAAQALEAVGLAEFSNYYPAQISGGMKQRAQLARALSLETPILLMDEPFAALDEQTRMVLGEDLSILLSKTNKTIVFVTHSLAEAVFLADRVAVMTARPGRFKMIIDVDEPHPRTPNFMLAERFTRMRNELFSSLHDEIRKTMAEQEKATVSVETLT